MAEKRPTGASSKAKQKIGGEQNTKKLLRLLVVMLCCVGSGYFFWTTMQILQTNEMNLAEASVPKPPDPTLETEKNEIASVEDGLTNLSKSSSQVMRMALQAEVQRNNPVDLPTTLTPQVISAPGGEEVIVVEPDPPMLTVSAVMITDGSQVSVVDDGSTRVIRNGAKLFDDQSGTVQEIKREGVIFRWKGKRYLVRVGDSVPERLKR
jgi:predicted ribosome-associated RNA-binding protein Tma20